MADVNLLALLVATITAFVIGGVYYGLLGTRVAQLSSAAAASGSMPPWKVLVELLRCLVLASVVAVLVGLADLDQWTGGLTLGAVLWVGFPLVLWTGAIIHESTPWKLAAIHAGDWLFKLLATGVILSGWEGAFGG